MAALIVLLVNLLVYWKTFGYPFLWDDWEILYSIIFHGSARYILDRLLPFGMILYRPLSAIYFVVAYHLFGDHALGFHLLGVALHTCNALLLISITGHITRNSLCAVFVGILYAATATVHIDPMMWFVGFFDLGGAFFFFLSILFFVRRKTGLSASSYACSILIKEAAVAAPAILFLYAFLLDQENQRLSAPLRQSLVRVLPHGSILAVYAVMRWFAVSPLSLTGDNPFRTRLWGGHILVNCTSYIHWSIDILSPLKGIRASDAVIDIGTAAALACIIAYFVAGYFRGERERSLRELRFAEFCCAWMLLGLLPVLFLENHTNRYLFTYSLPAYLLLAYFGITRLLSLFSLPRRVIRAFMVLLVAANCIAAQQFVSSQEKAFSDEMPTVDGIFRLMQLGKIVNLTENFLRTAHPQLPHDATIIADCFEPKAFGFMYGTRVFYRDSTIHVVQARYVRADARGLYVPGNVYATAGYFDKEPDSSRVYLDPAKTVMFVYFHDGIEGINPAEAFPVERAPE